MRNGSNDGMILISIVMFVLLVIKLSVAPTLSWWVVIFPVTLGVIGLGVGMTLFLITASLYTLLIIYVAIQALIKNTA